MYTIFLSFLALFSIVTTENNTNIHNTIFNNSQLYYSNILSLLPDQKDSWTLPNNKNTQTMFKSISSLDNFALYITIQHQPNKQPQSKPPTTKGMWMWLFIDSIVNRTDYIDNIKDDFYKDSYSGYGIKINNKNMIAIKSNLKQVVDVNQFTDKNPTVNKHIVDISDYHEGIYCRISRYEEIMYFEISKNGVDFELWFLDQPETPDTKDLKWRMQINSNLKTESISYIIKDVYSMDFNLFEKDNYGANGNNNNNNNKNTLISKEIEGIYEKWSLISTLISDLSNKINMTKEINKNIFNSLPEHSSQSLDKLKYLINLTQDDTPDVATSNSTSLTTLMTWIRDITWYQHNLVKEDSKANSESDSLIHLLNRMKTQQKAMNETLVSIYTTVKLSVNELNKKSEAISEYTTFDKISMLFIIITGIFIVLIYKKINDNDLINLAQKQTIPLPPKIFNNKRQNENNQIELV